MYVDGVHPIGAANVIVKKPPFSGAFKNTVGGVFRIECASQRPVKGSSDPEQARRHRCRSRRTRWIADELPLELGVDGRFRRIGGELWRDRRGHVSAIRTCGAQRELYTHEACDEPSS